MDWNGPAYRGWCIGRGRPLLAPCREPADVNAPCHPSFLVSGEQLFARRQQAHIGARQPQSKNAERGTYLRPLSVGALRAALEYPWRKRDCCRHRIAILPVRHRSGRMREMREVWIT